MLLSVTTIDSEVMELIRDQDRTELLSMYNRAWDGAIHDYLHHIALYTNPSFGIGKISPMSLNGLHHRVDAWGEDMHSTLQESCARRGGARRRKMDACLHPTPPVCGSRPGS